MKKENLRRNYVVPVGEFRGEVDESKVDPAWRLIHKLRQQHGLSIVDVGMFVGSTGSTVSKGERGGHVSINVTRTILREFGYDLKIVPKGEGDE